MAIVREDKYRKLYEKYLSEDKGSLRASCKRNNISDSTVRAWFSRFDLEKPPAASILVPFSVIPEIESMLGSSFPNATLRNLQLTTNNGIVVVISEMTLLSLSSLVKSLIE